METTALLTSGMLEPLVDGINANLGVLLPVGLGIMATMIGVKLIPRIVHKFL